MGVRLNDGERDCQAFHDADNRLCSYDSQAGLPALRVHAAFFAGCFCFLRDFAVVFFFAPVSSRLLCRTETRSITFVGLGVFFGVSSISFPPASTFSSITSMSASR